MNTPTLSLTGTMFRAAIIATLVTVIAGCSHDPPPLVPHYTPAPQGTPVVSGTAQDPIVNNPPPGKPNHLSPEMQAEIEHYRTVGGNTPNR